MGVSVLPSAVGKRDGTRAAGGLPRPGAHRRQSRRGAAGGPGPRPSRRTGSAARPSAAPVWEPKREPKAGRSVGQRWAMAGTCTRSRERPDAAIAGRQWLRTWRCGPMKGTWRGKACMPASSGSGRPAAWRSCARRRAPRLPPRLPLRFTARVPEISSRAPHAAAAACSCCSEQLPSSSAAAAAACCTCCGLSSCCKLHAGLPLPPAAASCGAAAAASAASAAPEPSPAPPAGLSAGTPSSAGPSTIGHSSGCPTAAMNEPSSASRQAASAAAYSSCSADSGRWAQALH